MKRRGKPYYPPKGMALLAVMMFMSLSEREYVNWLKTNKWLIELAELPDTPDRRSIKRVYPEKVYIQCCLVCKEVSINYAPKPNYEIMRACRKNIIVRL